MIKSKMNKLKSAELLLLFWNRSVYQGSLYVELINAICKRKSDIK